MRESTSARARGSDTRIHRADTNADADSLDHLLNACRHLPVNLIKSEFAKTGSYFAPTLYALTTRDQAG